MRPTFQLFFTINVLFYSVFCVGSLGAQENNTSLKSSEDYVRMIKYYRYLNPDSALFYVKKGMAHAEAHNDQLGKAALLNQYGMIEDNATNTESSREKYLAAAQIYRSKKDETGLASTLIRLAGVERKKGNFDKSLAYAMEASTISAKKADKLGMLEAKVALVQSYYQLNKIDIALKHLLIAEKLSSQVPLSNVSLDMYIQFGTIYNRLGEFDKSISYIEKGLAKSNKTEYNGIRVSLLLLLGQAYQGKGDNKRALEVLKQSLELAVHIKNLAREQNALMQLASLYEKEDPDSALIYFKRSLVIATNLKKYRHQIAVLEKIGTIYKQKGKLNEALAIREEVNALADKVYYKDMAKQVFSLEAAYELEKSKAKLRELTIKNTKASNQKNIILSIAIGTFIILLITLIYFTRAKHLNKLLQNANASLEESNYVKDKFFSIIAHDIRSPLASTIGVLELIDEDELDEETKKDTIKKLISHCGSSLEILDKLLKWGHMQIKGVILNPTEFNPLPNINRNIALLESASEKKQIIIETEVPDHIIIKADADHFDFVIRNLMANAIKFTGVGGSIKIKAQEVPEENTIRFSVIDNGVGINKARLAKLFQLTSTGTKGTSAEEGTSLGLIICREFVLANKGNLEVQSEEGKGTTFSFTMKGFLKKIA
ncbi:ATP-binding protein [Pedobacter sp. UBA4863]|uniref:tetratricopeptide repeat-containing sensor histidine kinase n=1 Tax=Pedobacter sp. UBA4863 TaxID=1947060 RepID=UPI0025EE11FB|nr:ATP-binding protein [Pedobacter sp. UBA4863]